MNPTFVAPPPPNVLPQVSGGAPPCRPQWLGCSTALMDSKEDITAQPNSEAKTLTYCGPVSFGESSMGMLEGKGDRPGGLSVVGKP